MEYVPHAHSHASANANLISRINIISARRRSLSDAHTPLLPSIHAMYTVSLLEFQPLSPSVSSSLTLIDLMYAKWSRLPGCATLELPVVAQMRPLPRHVLLALAAPPREPFARLLRLQHEALGLHDVEKQLADHGGIRGAGHLQAGAESAISEMGVNG